MVFKLLLFTYMQEIEPQNKNAPGRLSKVLTDLCVKPLGSMLSSIMIIGLLLPLSEAQASMSCQLLFSKASAPVWKPTDPLQFGEVITSLNKLKSSDKDTEVAKDPSTKLWRIKSKAYSASKFVLDLVEPLRTSEELQEGPIFDYVNFKQIKYFAHQDVGNGLVLNLKSNQKAFRLRLRIEGRSNEKGDPYSAVADIDISNSSELIKIPWAKFLMENTLSATPTALLDFKSVHIENFHGPGMHIDRVTHAPLDQPYLIKSGNAFEPALLDIRRLAFEVIPLDSSRGVELALGESIYRDFSLDYLTKNRSYLELALQMMLQMQGGKDFLAHTLKKYKDPAAIQFAIRTINQGPEKIAAVLAS